MLFAAFPLAYEARSHVEITGKDRLAGALPQTKRADLFGPQKPNGREAKVIEFPHCPLVHDPGLVQSFRSLVNRRHQAATVLLARRI